MDVRLWPRLVVVRIRVSAVARACRPPGHEVCHATSQVERYHWSAPCCRFTTRRRAAGAVSPGARRDRNQWHAARDHFRRRRLDRRQRRACSTTWPPTHREVRVLHLSRNFGHQAAVQAGLAHAAGDVVLLMDSDMQDAPEALPRFLLQWQAGYDVVYAVRRDRQERWWKRVLFAALSSHCCPRSPTRRSRSTPATSA